ncbi:hypothetical protein FA95DRAFT_1563426 [Auriscalpium vulgare]|uniref:Uncharacterized protein n=1 Tax=Auriscalpium vulgare TaxID=40419 RepID=A0ACB8RGU2_9AGAM|nr:hypothetical protein FA95DRAFT_1563426 [Auriscalpium vulgare]
MAPTIGLSPFPETIFLETVKGTLRLFINLTTLDTILLSLVVLLAYTSPVARPTVHAVVGLITLGIGIEVASINIYVLACSYLSPDTTLNPLTIVILSMLNTATPILTDTVLLGHLISSAAVHQPSRVKLALTMSAPVLLKVGRLANAVLYMIDCGRYVLTSVTSPDGIPDESILVDSQARSMQIACTLQMIDNMYSLTIFWIGVMKERLLPHHRRSAIASQSLGGIIWTGASNFAAPLLLGVAQLATSALLPDTNTAFYIEQVKVLLNVAGAGSATVVATLMRYRARVRFDVGEATALRPALMKSYASMTNGKTAAEEGEDEDYGQKFKPEVVDANVTAEQRQFHLSFPTL